jgi:hypothetical protein
MGENGAAGASGRLEMHRLGSFARQADFMRKNSFTPSSDDVRAASAGIVEEVSHAI